MGLQESSQICYRHTLKLPGYDWVFVWLYKMPKYNHGWTEWKVKSYASSWENFTLCPRYPFKYFEGSDGGLLRGKVYHISSGSWTYISLSRSTKFTELTYCIYHLYFSNPEHARNIWHWTLSWVNLKIMRLYLIYVLFQLRWYIDLKVKMNTCRWKLLEQFKMNRPVPFNCMVPVLSQIYGKLLVVLVTVWRNVPQLASIS